MMRAEQALERLRTLPTLPFDEAMPNLPFAVLAPHPDDESLGCGGIIAQSCDHGCPPLVVILTDGTFSHPKSRLYPADRLRKLRETETCAATACLGLPPDRVIFLGYRDTAAPREGLALEEAASRLARLVRQAGCTAILAPWRHDPHCDHEAAFAIAETACRIACLRLLAYPVWGLTLPPETLLPETSLAGFQIDIVSEIDRKRAAIHAHASQYAGLIPDDPEGFQMQPQFIEMFLQGREIFIHPTRTDQAAA